MGDADPVVMLGTITFSIAFAATIAYLGLTLPSVSYLSLEIHPG